MTILNFHILNILCCSRKRLIFRNVWTLWRNYVLLKIVTDSGVHGVGDGTLNGRELAVAELLEQHLKPLLIGRDADRIEDIWQDLFRGTYWRGGPVLNTALAAIDMALWDIKGKRAQLPLYSLLGGKTRNAVLCYGHASGDSIPDTAQHAQQLIDVGYRVVRCQTQIPGTQGTYGAGRGDAPRGERLPFVETWEPTPYLNTIPKLFEFLRRELGDEIELLHDVHERLNPIQAARLARELEPFHLFFLEDPLRPEHKERFRLIRDHSTTPLAMGELFTNKEVEVDHIVPAGSLKTFDDLPEFVERMFCEADGFQVLCKPCHQLKTNAERAARKS